MKKCCSGAVIVFLEIIFFLLLCLDKIILQSFLWRLLGKGVGYEIWETSLSSAGGSDGLRCGFISHGLWLLW